MNKGKHLVESGKHTVDGKSNSPLIGPFKGINKDMKGNLCNFYINIRVLKTDFRLWPEVLEGLGSSGRLVGTISTYPGTCQCPWYTVGQGRIGSIGDILVSQTGV